MKTDNAILTGMFIAFAIFSMVTLAFMQVDKQGCVIITETGDVLSSPVDGEDDGAYYCPTGQHSSSQPKEN